MLLRTSVILIICTILISCDSGGTGYSWWATSRSVSMSVTTDSETGTSNSGYAPLQVNALVMVQVKYGESKQTDVIRVELDFDDGTGWEDVTTAWKQKQDMTIYSLEDQMQPHSYNDPGEYSVSCRVTFADGEVIAYPSSGVTPPTVTVLEPTT